MVQERSERQRHAEGWRPAAYSLGFVLALVGWMWAVAGMKVTTPALVAFEDSLGWTGWVYMFGLFALAVVWILVSIKSARHRRRGAGTAGALERVTNHVRAKRVLDDHPGLWAAFSVVVWPYLLLTSAPETLQVVADGDGLKAIVAVAAWLGLLVFSIVTIFRAVRRAMQAGSPAVA